MKISATIITIGDELLIGQVVDTNSAWMGEQLNAFGIPIKEKLAVSDTYDGIQSALERALAQSEIVLITGGLGPTKDDITKKAIAEYFGVDMLFDEGTWDRIQRLFAKWGRETTDLHREQCYMPANCSLLENRMGTAPGMLFEIGSKSIVSMPGIPYEMKYIFENGVLPLVRERYMGQAIVHLTIKTAGMGESVIANQIDDIIQTFPDNLTIAYLPNLGQVRLRLSATGENQAELQEQISTFSALIEERLGDLVFGFGTDSLSTVIQQIAKEKGLMIGTAESCSGGKVATKIVEEAGASAVFGGSIVSYTNELKMSLLGVKEDTLNNYGAVSEQTVREMVSGCLKALNVDVAVAVSGIAGPSGGSEEKPVGTIWMAVGAKDRTETFLLKAGKNRAKNIEYATNYALNLLRKFLTAI